jgi:hypothetical protein
MATKKKQVAKKLKAAQPAQKAKGSLLRSPKLWVVVGALALFGSGIYYGVSTLLDMQEEYKDSIAMATMDYEDEVIYQAYKSDEAELAFSETDGSLLAYTITTGTDVMAMDDYSLLDLLPETGKNKAEKEKPKKADKVVKVKVDNKAAKAEAERQAKLEAKDAQAKANAEQKAANKKAAAAAAAAEAKKKLTLRFVGPKALESACQTSDSDCQVWGNRKVVDGVNGSIKFVKKGNNGISQYRVKGVDKNGKNVAATVKCGGKTVQSDGSKAGCCCAADWDTCSNFVLPAPDGRSQLGPRICP